MPLLGSKLSYGYSRWSLPMGWVNSQARLLGKLPKHEFIVIFQVAARSQHHLIKQVIGLPGDHVQMVHDRLSINSALVPRKEMPAAAASSESMGHSMPSADTPRRCQRPGYRSSNTLGWAFG